MCRPSFGGKQEKNNPGPTKNLFKMLFYETSRLDWDGKKEAAS